MPAAIQSYTDLASDRQKHPLTEAGKQAAVDRNHYHGNTDVKSDHNLSDTRRKGALTAPPGQSASDAYVRRDYNWLEYFATEVAKVEQAVVQARDKLRNVDVKPGNFTQANHVKTTTEKLKTDYIANLDRVQNAVRHLVDQTREVAKTYKTADEMNNVSVDRLKTMFDQISGELGKLSPVTVKDKPVT